MKWIGDRGDFDQDPEVGPEGAFRLLIRQSEGGLHWLHRRFLPFRPDSFGCWSIDVNFRHRPGEPGNLNARDENNGLENLEDASPE